LGCRNPRRGVVEHQGGAVLAEHGDGDVGDPPDALDALALHRVAHAGLLREGQPVDGEGLAAGVKPVEACDELAAERRDLSGFGRRDDDTEQRLLPVGLRPHEAQRAAARRLVVRRGARGVAHGAQPRERRDEARVIDDAVGHVGQRVRARDVAAEDERAGWTAHDALGGVAVGEPVSRAHECVDVQAVEVA
jgi:hypothetical protein